MKRALVTRVMWMLAAALLWAAMGNAAAPLCEETDEPAPDVTTFVVSKLRPASEGWVVHADCSVTVVNIPLGGTSLYGYGIERVASMLTTVTSVSMDEPLSHGADFSGATQLSKLVLSDFSPELVKNLVLPNSVTRLELYGDAVSIDKVKLPDSLLQFFTTNHALTSLENVKFPASLQELNVKASALTSLDKVQLPQKLKSLWFTSPLQSLDGVALPETILDLTLYETAITSISNLKLPPYLTSMTLEAQNISSLKNVSFPATLKSLTLGTSAPATDIILPKRLTSLYLTNPTTTIERITLPSTLTLFSARAKVVKGIKWPSTLTGLDFGSDPVTSFEIRQSDLPIFRALTYVPGLFLYVSMKVCSDPTGNLTVVVNTITNWTLCVISDERFEALYGVVETPSPTPTTTPSQAGSASDEDSQSGSTTDSGNTSSDGANDSSGPLDEADVGEEGGEDDDAPPGSKNSKKTRTPSSTRPRTPQSKSPSSIVPASQSLRPTVASVAPQPGRRVNSTAASVESVPGTKTPSAKGSRSEVVQVNKPMDTSIVIAVIVAGVVLAFIIAGFVVRALVVRSRKKEKTADHYESLDTPSLTSDPSLLSQETTTANAKSLVFAANDVRSDPLLLPYRFPQRDIVIKEQISQQGFTTILRGILQGQDVAVKRVQAASCGDPVAVACFMEEIRMCASVDHPKIVSFIGMTWSNEYDLSAVVEYMAGGSLEAVLHSQPEPPAEPGCWSAPWSTNRIKSKTSIALDVVEALQYLHAFHTPILHRDLRARNVLLDTAGNAKLDSFAINRNASVDETMRGEGGSVAWIAPEVLLGEEHTEKADVYALGVLMVELDSCRHPFSSLVVGQRDDSGSTSENEIAQKNIQIAVQVSAGTLRPTVSSSCPQRVAALVAQCLEFEATNRPTVTQVITELRSIRDAL